MARGSNLLVVSALAVSLLCAGCSSDPDAAPATTRPTTSTAPSAVPNGYLFSRNGSISELTRDPTFQPSTSLPTTTSSDTSAPVVGLGSAMTAVRMAKPASAEPGSVANSVKVTFECAIGPDEAIHSVAYELRDRTLIVSATISGSAGASCAPGDGASIQLPLDSPWVVGTPVEAGDLDDQN